MGTITITISEKAESFLRGKNNFKGDMGRFVSELLEREADKVEA
jgi:KaiC/GvpD/RAD55 family RecA-like ATPase